jgi:trans-2,3-dihydro-3-hydroxyanthranilic acid synthase
VAAYPLPTEADLPPQRVDWAPDPSRAVLLVHDLQAYFLRPFATDRSPLGEMLANVAAIRAACARSGVPVAYTAQPGDMTAEQRGLLADFWGPGMRTADADRRVVDAVAPGEGDRVFVKWRYSAFHRSDLLAMLRDSGRDQLVICGVFAHIGCLMTAVDAFTNDIQPFLVADGIADFSEDQHRLALSYAASCCAATPTAARVVDRLDTPGGDR